MGRPLPLIFALLARARPESPSQENSLPHGTRSWSLKVAGWIPKRIRKNCTKAKLWGCLTPASMKGALEFSAGPPLYGEDRRFVSTNSISRSEAGFRIVDGRSPARCSIPITTAVKVYFKLAREFPTRIYVRRLGSDRPHSIRLNF